MRESGFVSLISPMTLLEGKDESSTAKDLISSPIATIDDTKQGVGAGTTGSTKSTIPPSASLLGQCRPSSRDEELSHSTQTSPGLCGIAINTEVTINPKRSIDFVDVVMEPNTSAPDEKISDSQVLTVAASLPSVADVRNTLPSERASPSFIGLPRPRTAYDQGRLPEQQYRYKRSEEFMTQPRIYEVDFIVHWQLLDFVQTEFDPSLGKEIDLGKVITLNGSGTNAQAITAAEYMTQQWPRSGAGLLKALQTAIVAKRFDSKGQWKVALAQCLILYGPAQVLFNVLSASLEACSS